MAKTFKSKEEERIYNSWKTIKRNCTNPNAPDYKIYGGRGITFYEEWDNFEAFYKWAMKNGYELGKVLQRKDRNGDFTPENCYYVDKSERNTGVRSNSFTVEYNGKVYTNESFAREVNINPHITLKLLKAGKKPEEIVAERDPNWDKYICYGHSSDSKYLTEESKPNSPHHASFRVPRYTMNGVTAPMETLFEIFGKDDAFLANASPELLGNQKFIRSALSVNPKAFFSLPKSMQEDKDLALFVIDHDSSLLNRLPTSLQIDHDILYKVARSDPDVIRSLSPEIRKRPEVQQVERYIERWKPIPWPKIYKTWKAQKTYPEFGRQAENVEVIDIPLNYNPEEGYYYGYDWLASDSVPKNITNDPYTFFFSMEHANKGTLRTAARLAESETAEERAAAWINATVEEIMRTAKRINSEQHVFLTKIMRSASDFLVGAGYSYNWHHRMSKFVPEIYISQEQIANVKPGNIGALIRLIQMNAARVQSEYQILRYCSVNAPKKLPSLSRGNEFYAEEGDPNE